MTVKVLVGAFNQEKALVGPFSVIVKPMDSFTALNWIYRDYAGLQVPPLQGRDHRAQHRRGGERRPRPQPRG